MWGGRMGQCRAGVDGPRELDLAGHGGRREEEEGEEAAQRRGSGVFIGQRAPGRGEWCLGEADLVRGGSTASWRSGQQRCAWRGVVSARESAWDACAREKVPRGGPGGARGVPRVHLAAGAPWTRSTGGVWRATGENRAKGPAPWREMEVRAYLRFLKIQGPLGKLKISPT